MAWFKLENLVSPIMLISPSRSEVEPHHKLGTSDQHFVGAFVARINRRVSRSTADMHDMISPISLAAPKVCRQSISLSPRVSLDPKLPKDSPVPGIDDKSGCFYSGDSFRDGIKGILEGCEVTDKCE